MKTFRRRTARAPQTASLGVDAPAPVLKDPDPVETPRTHAFMYVVDDDARTRRTVTLVFAITSAAAVLVSLLALLAAVLGPSALAIGSGGSVGGAVLTAVARKLSGRP
ncbi:MAG TPA: hypothetical protein VLJ59_06860 [Mycobacteriales bacterium]|nr:hypothetical protein [Mycobacteriales bacterium]